MKHSVGLFSVLMLMLLTSAVYSQTISPDAQTLRDLLSYPTCQRTCFMGIEPGVTTQEQVKAYFAANNIVHTVFAGIKNDDEPNGIYYWHLDSTLPFVTSNEVSSYVEFKDGIVGVIGLFVDVPIPAILEAYGAPPIFLQSDTVYLLIYPTEKLAFQVMKRISTEKANLVYIVTDEVLDEFLNISPYPPVQNCVQPTVVCTVQTATPTPIFTPSATIQSEAQSLRSVFNALTCQRACWLGIEPGVTMQNEVQTILSDLGIEYEVKDELGLGADPVNNPYGWMPDDDLPFIDTVGGKVEVRIYFSEGIVQGIHLPVNVPVKMIIEEYGAPIQVRHLNTMFELVYPQLGMNFFVSSSLGTDHATMLTLFSEKGALQNVEDTGSPYLLQDCTLFSTPCTIATATPQPIESNP